jgi:aspartate racemase
MKTIGIIGGMSWESSIEYYRLANHYAKARLGGHHSARTLLLSVDFAPIEALQQAGDWTALAALMSEAAQQLERGGADIVVLATNTMHRVYEAIEGAVTVPFLHIADATGAALHAAGIERVGLLGTRYTMEHPFYAERLQEKYGLATQVPPRDDREAIHRIIYDELCHGIVTAPSRARFREAITRLQHDGAQAVILGCTEITLLIKPEDSPLPVFDTTALHVAAAVDWAIRD